MMRSIVLAALLIAPLLLIQISCSSVDTTDEDIMMALDDETGAGIGPGVGASEGIEGELLDDAAIAEEFTGEILAPEEDFAMDDSAMDAPVGGDFAEFADEGFSEESFSEEGFVEDGMGFEGEFSEESMDDGMGGFEDEFAQDFDEAFAAEPVDDGMAMGEPIAEQDPMMQEQALQAAEPVPAPELVQQEPVFEEPAFDSPSAQSFVGSNDIQINDIRYLANEAGGTVVIDASEPISYQTRVNPETNQFIVEMAGAKLPERLKRPYILKEFNGAFAAINAYQPAGSNTVRVVIQLKGSGASQPIVQQEANSLVVIPASNTPVEMVAQQESAQAPPPGAAEEISLDGSADSQSFDVEAARADQQLLGARTLDEFLMGNSRFYGRRISIQVKDVNVREALNFISDEGGINLVISDDVKGNISLKLKEVPWDQALVTVMRSMKLGYLRQGNVIRISTLKNLQEETDAARQIIEAQKAMTPLRVKVIPVSFGKVEDMVKQVQSFLTEKRGNVVADPRTSSLIVTDTNDVLQKVVRLVKELDLPPAQVMIEGKIVEASEDFKERLGVNWNLENSQLEISQAGGRGGAPIDLISNLGVSPLESSVISESPLLWEFNIGTMDILGNLSAALALAEIDSLAKVVSSPRVVTMNKEKAEISQKGQQVTVTQVRDQQGNILPQVNREDVTLNLTVIPQITADGSVIMEVEVKRQFVGAEVNAETGARPINTREAKTKILVKNGQTAVIGGIYQSDVTESEAGVPLLKDIPVLGWLFKSKSLDKLKNELLIFLTPKILNTEDMAVES